MSNKLIVVVVNESDFRFMSFISTPWKLMLSCFFAERHNEVWK